MSKEFISQFVRFKEKEGKSIHTVRNYELQLNRYFKGANEINLNKGKHNKYIINTEAYLKSIKAKVMAEEVKRNTFKTHAMIIKSYLGYLEALELCEVPDINYSKLFRLLIDDKTERRIMNKTQTIKLKRGLKTEDMPWRLIFRLALMRGLRRSEILSIRHQDINLYKDYVNVLRKGKKERVPVKISSEMYVELRNYSDQTIRTEVIDGMRKGRDFEYVFKISPNYLTAKAKLLTKKYLGKEYLMHEFRHTAINNYILMLAKEGLTKTESIIEAAEFAGHDDPGVTKRSYFNAEISNKFETLRDNDRLERFIDAQ